MLSDEHIKEAFEVFWPKLQKERDNLPKDEPAKNPARTEKQILEEILALVRAQPVPRPSVTVNREKYVEPPIDPIVKKIAEELLKFETVRGVGLPKPGGPLRLVANDGRGNDL